MPFRRPEPRARPAPCARTPGASAAARSSAFLTVVAPQSTSRARFWHRALAFTMWARSRRASKVHSRTPPLSKEKAAETAVTESSFRGACSSGSALIYPPVLRSAGVARGEGWPWGPRRGLRNLKASRGGVTSGTSHGPIFKELASEETTASENHLEVRSLTRDRKGLSKLQNQPSPRDLRAIHWPGTSHLCAGVSSFC